MLKLVSDSKQQSAHLTVEQVSWSCPEKRVLEQISFEVEQGEFVGLLGPNGVGKSTLLRCLYRYLKPDSGKVLLNGTPVWSLTQRQFAQQVAVVTQHCPTGFSMTVRQFMATGLLAHQRFWQRSSKLLDQQQVDEMLQRVALLPKAEQRFESLSGGEQQRVLIARAMLQKPQLMVLDEPTNHLDIRYQIETLQLVKSLGITVIASIHDLNLAAAFCDRLALLEQGKLVAMGDVDDVLTSSQLKRVYGVETIIDRHPLQDTPRVTYQFAPATQEVTQSNAIG
ncbi:ABC transporter ATP-binding protein [Ferrimonas lipolytica]|uniref:ABC transporter ATP-binding protein n=1 Tax=Ferrimonas lipolytica TaxID=2724191 RepID=A0A6H1UB46_9GAMM|nr:ABC transporter ATP-binding protein [Ferrimonas lipolytica]QIZ76264.1 ABC transporter ATP-binding protein [Ferrimonas lipolytica]